MLDSLYVQEGEHTGEPSEANKYSVEKAAEVDSLTASLTMAQAGLYSVYSENRNKLYTDNAAIVLPKLISMAERERESDYTEESWAAFAQALSAAKAAEKPAIMGTEEDEEKAEAYYKAFDDLYDAYYWGLDAKGGYDYSCLPDHGPDRREK